MPNYLLYKRHFTYKQWEKKEVAGFRSQLTNFIGILNARTSLFFTTDLNRSGITFFFLTTNPMLGQDLELKYSMELTTDVPNLDLLGIESGNEELKGLLKSNNRN